MVCCFNSLLQVLLVLPAVWQSMNNRHGDRQPQVNASVFGGPCAACSFERLVHDLRPGSYKRGKSSACVVDFVFVRCVVCVTSKQAPA